jgi:hypothetical protein
MKQLILLLSVLILSSFKLSQSGGKNWYICTNCCKTKQADEAPWLSGCSKSSSNSHNFAFCGKAGDFNYTCRNCDAEVYLTSSSSPAASKCCASGGTHNWYHN